VEEVHVVAAVVDSAVVEEELAPVAAVPDATVVAVAVAIVEHSVVDTAVAVDGESSAVVEDAETNFVVVAAAVELVVQPTVVGFVWLLRDDGVALQLAVLSFVYVVLLVVAGDARQLAVSHIYDVARQLVVPPFVVDVLLRRHGDDVPLQPVVDVPLHAFGVPPQQRDDETLLRAASNVLLRKPDDAPHLPLPDAVLFVPVWLRRRQVGLLLAAQNRYPAFALRQLPVPTLPVPYLQY